MKTRLEAQTSVRKLLVASLVIGCLAAAEARADTTPVFELEVMVARLTSQQSKIDKGAKRLHAELKHVSPSGFSPRTILSPLLFSSNSSLRSGFNFWKLSVYSSNKI